MAEAHDPTVPLRPFTFLRRSPGVSAPTDEAGLLRTRRQTAQKPARLLDVSRSRDRRAFAEPPAQTGAHTSGAPPSFAGGHAEHAVAGGFRYSEPRSSSLRAYVSGTASTGAVAGAAGAVAEAEAPAVQARPAGYQQPFFVAQNYQNPAAHRKTLHERLHGEQSQHPRFTDAASGYSSQPHSYPAPPPALMHEPEASSFLRGVGGNARSSSPAPAPAPALARDVEASSSQISLPNCCKDGGAEGKTGSRSRSASVGGGAPGDAKGMQGVVMEAMKSLQRCETENEVQVNAYTAAVPRKPAGLILMLCVFAGRKLRSGG